MNRSTFVGRSFLSLALCAVFLMLPAPREATAQAADDLRLFGFFQAQYRYSQEEGLNSPDRMSSFSVQQLNAFLAKEFNPTFSAFVGAELTNTFSTQDGWGTLRLEEAWVRYNRSSALNVKAGLLVPSFNNLNEIKNRTPLLPYVFRPFAYETTFSTVLNIDALVPEQAYVQVYGALPAGKVRFDYAAYVGNSESNYVAKTAVGTVTAGLDTTTSKMVGGRVGLRWRSLKAGVSGTLDKQLVDVVEVNDVRIPIGLGDADRGRLGADVSFYLGRFYAEAEAIRVFNRLDDEQQARLDFLANSPQSPLNGFLTGELDLSFYYALLGYNVTDQLFAYAAYDFFKDGSNAVLVEGFDAYTVGVSYRPIDQVVVKTQYVRSDTRENPLAKVSNDTFFIGVSVSF